MRIDTLNTRTLLPESLETLCVNCIDRGRAKTPDTLKQIAGAGRCFHLSGLLETVFQAMACTCISIDISILEEFMARHYYHIWTAKLSMGR
jgi:hypothetical protein